MFVRSIERRQRNSRQSGAVGRKDDSEYKNFHVQVEGARGILEGFEVGEHVIGFDALHCWNCSWNLVHDGGRRARL